MRRHKCQQVSFALFLGLFSFDRSVFRSLSTLFFCVACLRDVDEAPQIIFGKEINQSLLHNLKLTLALADSQPEHALPMAEDAAEVRTSVKKGLEIDLLKSKRGLLCTSKRDLLALQT